MKKPARKKAAEPQDIKMEWRAVNVETTAELGEFDRVAQRVTKAVEELNSALQEAHACSEMSVQLGWRKGELPVNLHYRIYQLTHTTMVYKVNLDMKDKPGTTDYWNGRYEPTDKFGKEHYTGTEAKD